MSDIIEIIPVSREMKLGDKSISVRPVTLRNEPKFRAACQRIFLASQEVSLNLNSTRSILDAVSTIAANHATDLADACACCTVGLSQDEILDLPGDLSAHLLAAVVEVNADFFTRRVPKIMAHVAAALTPEIPQAGDGQTPSSF